LTGASFHALIDDVRLVDMPLSGYGGGSMGVPEPATIGLLALGSIVTLLRRRR